MVVRVMEKSINEKLLARRAKVRDVYEAGTGFAAGPSRGKGGEISGSRVSETSSPNTARLLADTFMDAVAGAAWEERLTIA